MLSKFVTAHVAMFDGHYRDLYCAKMPLVLLLDSFSASGEKIVAGRKFLLFAQAYVALRMT